MKKNMKNASIAIGLMLSALTVTSVQAQTEAASRIIDREGALSKNGTLQLCIEYSTLESEADREAYRKELDLRSQLSEADHKHIPLHEVATSMTMCGMYMSKGKPLAEQSRQIRPLTFKTVHVYPDMYYVTQSGIVVDAYERKEGSMPPKLVHEAPKVQESPTLKK
ncbi:hypothetical protein THMIRHAM_14680 [Thiomicrorhabdus immobilis]|uniref:Uncharacterized protein n=1 Tax=Thiomicrorhabdus immobilis TaxID=2791037 RepID=A0ABN6CX20_9GAMM|nr:hypothetical protein [Thiomicrorhabdus immobilis]BCN93683.1 hypothetical protein THMIRHAM_14680 [Thiomicrorhabdus immobilis]